MGSGMSSRLCPVGGKSTDSENSAKKQLDLPPLPKFEFPGPLGIDMSDAAGLVIMAIVNG